MQEKHIKASVYIATSLDGFIARRDGSIDWLNEAHSLVPAGEDCGFQAFMDSVDTLIMGRKTYQQVLSFGVWAYGQTPVIVLSRSSIAFPSSSSSPLSLLYNRGIKETRLVLPEPTYPTIPRDDPAGIFSEIPFRTS